MKSKCLIYCVIRCISWQIVNRKKTKSVCHYRNVDNSLTYFSNVVLFNMVTRRVLVYDLETNETRYDISSPFLIIITKYKNWLHKFSIFFFIFFQVVV